MDEVQVGLDHAPGFSRRNFIRTGLFTGSALALLNSRWASPLMKAAEAAAPDLLHETFNGLLAFIVPGPDAYSQAQAVTSPTPGGVDANVLEALIGTLDL